MIVARNKADNTIYFNDAVTANSFWNEQGVQPKDIVKAVDGEVLTPENMQLTFQKMYMWQPGTDFEMTLVRNGEEIFLKDTLTQSYTTGKSLQEKVTATDAQKTLRKAWLKD